MWDGLQKLQQLGEAVVGDTALLGEVMVIRRDELADGHDAGRLALQQVDDFSAKLDKLGISNWALAALNPWLCKQQTNTFLKSLK